MKKKILGLICFVLLLSGLEFLAATQGPTLLLSDVLSGEILEQQYQGGKWQYTSGGADATANHRLVMTQVTYIDQEAVHERITEILDKRINVDWIKSLVWLGIFTTMWFIGFKRVFSVGILCLLFLYATTFAWQQEAALLAKAHREDEGLITMTYQVSYNGSWTTASQIVPWQASQGILQLPDAAYGTGIYTPNP